MNKSKIEKRQDGAADDISTKPKLQRQATLA